MSVYQIISILTTRSTPSSLCELTDDVFAKTCLSELRQSRPYELNSALQQRQPELGLRLLLSIICVARQEATEGQIWPAVRTGLNLSEQAGEVIFLGNGHPREEVKVLIEKTCRKFHLRNIFGQDGAHEWFGSIYLQFGFTKRGFIKMLPEWLMGYNRPNTIGRLLNDPELKSESFKKLWETLLAFRRGNAVESNTRRIIEESPWVLPDWADELLLATKKKPHLSPAIYRSSFSAAGSAPRCFLSEPRLVTDNQLGDSRWQMQLAGLTELELIGASFCVRLRCGEAAVQEIFLRKQPDGSLSNLTHCFEFPLASAKESQVSATITDQQGREVAAQDIYLFDPDADIIAFSERGYLDDSFVMRGPRSNALYFVLVRSDLRLIPQSAAWHRFSAMGYTLHRLHVESGQQLQMLFEDGEELWSSVAGGHHGAPNSFANLRTQKCELSPSDNPSLYDPATTEVVLRVSGISDATILSAQWRSTQLCAEQIQPASQLAWRIRGIPKLEALLAPRVLLKLRIQWGDSVHRTQVEWKPNVVGIFEQSRGKASCGEFFSTRNNEQLKRGRYTIIPKPMTLDQQGRGLKWSLFEGDRFVSELREGSPQSFFDLGAYGQELSIRMGQFNREGNPTPLVKEVADKGLFHIYAVNPFLGRHYTFDAWATPEMGEEHTLHYGLIHQKGIQEAAGERMVFADDKAMFDPFPNQSCDYLVLAYAGERLATWWRVPKEGSSWSNNLAEVSDDVDARRAAFTIRWAKLPILSQLHYYHVRDFLRRFPHVVLGEWLCGPKVRKDGRRIAAENTEAWHDAVRAVIQGFQIEQAELSTEKKLKLIHCLPSLPTDDVNAKTLDTFQAVGACDPVLAGRMIRFWLSTQPTQHIRKSMIGALLNGHKSLELEMECLKNATQGADDHFLQSIVAAGVRAVCDPALEDREKWNLKSALTVAPFRRILHRKIVEKFLV